MVIKIYFKKDPFLFTRAQRVLNKAKQRKVITITNSIFSKWFPDTSFTKFMLSSTETDEKVRNTLNFKDLNRKFKALCTPASVYFVISFVAIVNVTTSPALAKVVVALLCNLYD